MKQTNMSVFGEKIEVRNARYAKYVKAITPQTSITKSLRNSFLVGGLICTIGQGLGDIFKMAFPAWQADFVGSVVSMILISTAILFTGLGFYDKIGKFAGAGAFLPITGFANAMASASMEFKTEGLTFGTSAKLFTIVGPVMVNGIVWSSVAGIIHLILMHIGIGGM